MTRPFNGYEKADEEDGVKEKTAIGPCFCPLSNRFKKIQSHFDVEGIINYMGGCCECNDPMTKKQLDAHLLQHSYGSRCDLLHRTTLKRLKHYYDGHLHREYDTRYIEDEKVKNKWKDDLDFIDESVNESNVNEIQNAIN